MASLKTTFKHFKQDAQPLDRAALILLVVLALLIGITIWSGDQTKPQVEDFSWEDQKIGVNDSGFLLTFNRPMDQASVEKNLKIDPPLLGKMSWSGRRMAYTLTEPIPYGTAFNLYLEEARDQLYTTQTGQIMEPFTGHFRSHDRAFAYIGLAGEELGRLMLVNFSQDDPKPIALTPADVRVIDFEAYPDGDRILFSGISEQAIATGSPDPQLFTVTTGIRTNLSESSNQTVTAGEVELVLDSKEYRNLKFDLSADGQIIVVQRVSQTDPGDIGAWMIQDDQPPQSLEIEGGDFLIAPDSQSLIIAQGPNLNTIFSLEPGSEPIEFLPKFGQVLSFARDGTAATMVRFNSDGTRSLFLVTNQGEEQELHRTPPFGNILDAQFDPTHSILYCLLTELLDTQTEYQEQPYIAGIDLETGKLMPLVILPNQQEINMSLSPDGLVLLFDQTVTATAQTNGFEEVPRTAGGDQITTSRVWLLPLEFSTEDGKVKVQPEELPFLGYAPHWLP